ncbi:MAG: PAS domain S-box protein [Thermomicrobiales bacterium]
MTALEHGGASFSPLTTARMVAQRDALAAPVAVELTAATLDAVFRSCPDPVVGLTLDGTITFWNAAAERMYGYAAADVVGRSGVELTPPDVRGAAVELMDQIRQGQAVPEVESVRQTRDGRRLDVLLTIFPVWDERQEIVGALAITRNISQRKRDQQALADSERRFRAAFDDAPMGMALLTLDGVFLQANPAGCAILGIPQPDLIGQKLAEVIHPGNFDEPQGSSAIGGFFNWDLVKDHNLPRWYVQPDGSVRWVLVQRSIVHDEFGQPAYVVGQAQDVTEGVQARENLSLARSQMQETLERVGGAFLEVDADWRVLRLNVAAETLLGRPRAALLGKTLTQAMAPEALAPIREALQTTMRTRQPTTVEQFAFPETGAWLAMRAYPAASGVAMFLRDVTAQRHLEDELRAAELRFQSLVEQLPAAVYLHAADEEQTILYLSPYFEVLTGYPTGPDSPFPSFVAWIMHIHPDDRERVLREGLARLGQGGQFLQEYRFRRADGAYIWVNDINSSMVDDSGAIIAWQGIIIDVTERKEASEVIARLAAIVDASEDAIFSRDIDGFITYWNDAAERLFGYSAEEMLGTPVSRVFVDGDIRYITPLGAFDDAVSRRMEVENQRKDGEIIDVAATIFPMRGADGEIVGVSGIVRDIGDRIAAERELRAALEAAQAGERAKGLFLAMMSHELRTPLQSVLGYADLLLAGPPGALKPEQQDDVESIRRGASRMVELIDQLIDLSRMEAGRLELVHDPVDVRAVLQKIWREAGLLADAKGLRLTLDIPEILPRVMGDPQRVRQLLMHLAGNAIKFTEAGVVHIAARHEHAWVVMTISDTGIGIAPDDLPHIFEEFRQLDTRLSRRHGGAGLGLAISRRLAEQMGGEIIVESAPGRGSVFALRLRVAPHEDAAGAGVP